jgi:hypothetical protein
VQEDTRQHAPGVRDPAGGGAPSAPPAWSPTACCPRRLRPPPSAGSAQNSYKSWRRAAGGRGRACKGRAASSPRARPGAADGFWAQVHRGFPHQGRPLRRLGHGAPPRPRPSSHALRVRLVGEGGTRRVQLVREACEISPRARAPPRTPFIPRARAPRAPFILPKPSSFLQSCSISGILLKPSRSAGSHRARAHAHTRSGRKDKNPNGSSNADGRCLSHWGQVLI